MPTATPSGEQSLPDEDAGDRTVNVAAKTEQNSHKNLTTATPAEQSSNQTDADRKTPTNEIPGWADCPQDESLDYHEEIFWKLLDSNPDSDRHRISPTTAKIVEEAFSHTSSTEKQKGIKRNQPIPNTHYTKVPKLDPTIQSRMSLLAKTLDRNLAGL